MNVRRLLTATLAAVVAASLMTSPAQAVAAKKITPKQAKALYEKAAKATAGWMGKNPFVISTVETYDGEVFNTESITRDRSKRVREAQMDEDTIIYVGSKMFVTMSEDTLRPYELEIATRLGLATSAKALRVEAASLGAGYANSRVKLVEEAMPRTGDFDYIMNNTPTCALGTQAKDQLLSCRITFEDLLQGTTTVNEYTYTISSGRITKLVTTYSGGTKITKTYKLFKGEIAVPKGPYLEYDAILADPGYAGAAVEYQSKLVLDSFVREARALAAFESREFPSAADWKIVADEQGLDLYDLGIGFEMQYKAEQSFEVCGVFTDDGARLEFASCSSLSFVKL